jgi:DNA-binding MarR family transcriptional regulator
MFREVAGDGESTETALSALLAAFTRLRRENDLLVTAIAHGHGLHAPDFRAVAHVRTTSGVTPRTLAGYLALSVSATTAMVDRLVAAGYVLRTPNPEDGRSVYLEITPTGADAVDDARALYVSAIEASVPAERRGDVTATFTQIADALAGVSVGRHVPANTLDSAHA